MSNNDNSIKTSHSSHHRSSHSSSGSSGHHNSHHHSKSSKYYKSSYIKDPSSEMERRGENIIYDNVRKERIRLMFKRSIFCLIALLLIVYVFYSMTRTSEDSRNLELFNKGISTEKVNELNNRIIDYKYYIDGLEDYIEELEERLSQYEEVDGMFVKDENQES